MCDYSLMGVPNRLARQGEELMVHRFYTGSIGLASPDDLARIAAVRASRDFWAKVKDFFSLPEREAVCAVCIPPGARLELDARLVSPDDPDRAAAMKAGRDFWTKVKDFFSLPEAEAVSAACGPLRGSPEFEGARGTEEVVFTQTNLTANSYRDAVRFASGRILHLQSLPEGLRVKVIDLSDAAGRKLEAPLANMESVPM